MTPLSLGPTLLEDQIARERINRFDHERIPERVVHARGVGAFGTFTLFESAEDVTCAGILTDTSRKTPLFARFSTVLGSRGSADTVRDVRGFAVKMYTEEGMCFQNEYYTVYVVYLTVFKGTGILLATTCRCSLFRTL